MLLTQTAAGSEVEETVQDTVDTITGFNKFIQEKGPDLIAFGIRILMALLIFIICHKVINWIRKITRASMERANSDTGARQFVDSLLKYGLHILLFLAIINSLGVESASIAATVASAGVAVGLALQGSLSNLAGGMLILFLKPFVVGDLLNTEKAFTVILGIFLSVAIAFFFGVIVQYLSRILFSFNYKKSSKYFIGLFGGLAATSIIYFMLIKGLKTSSFMTGEFKDMVYANTGMIVLGCMVFFTILMQVLHWLKVNVFKVVILMGTFALALAFAGNDLVNFIGVPLAGYSSYMDLMAQGGTTTTDTFLMTSLLGPAQTPWYFLVGSGVVMVIALATSKKAQNVVKTSLDLSRQSYLVLWYRLSL